MTDRVSSDSASNSPAPAADDRSHQGSEDIALPLSGISVVDASRHLPGHQAGLLLRGLGARIVKIERPPAGDPGRHVDRPRADAPYPAFVMLNGGVHSVALDVGQEAGYGQAMELLADADVFMHSFLPRTASRLRLDSESVLGVNPRLVYCHITGYSSDGGAGDEPGHDVNYLAHAGYFGLREPPPPAPPFGLSDVAAGSAAAFAIVAGLLARQQTNRGQVIEVPLALAARALIQSQLAVIADDPDKARTGLLSGSDPCYRAYEAADGTIVAIGAVEEKFRREVTAALSLDATASSAAIQTVIGSRSGEHWARVFASIRACVSVAPQPANGPAATLPAVMPFTSSFSPSTVGGPVPAVGEHGVATGVESGHRTATSVPADAAEDRDMRSTVTRRPVGR